MDKNVDNNNKNIADSNVDKKTEGKAPEENTAENSVENVVDETAVKAAKKDDGLSKVALLDGKGGILGVKAGMTQVYDEEGQAIAVTVIDLRPNVITQLKTKEKDGYRAVQIGFLEKKTKKMNKTETGRLKKLSLDNGFYHYQEFKLKDSAKVDGYRVGQVLSADFIKDGDFVDVTSISKGKGFQGVMKRYHFGGGPASHGASVCHRQIGSIGNRADPGKVFKNKKMAGHMGDRKVTVQNIRVFKVDNEQNVLLIHGSVPGSKSSVVTVQRAVKKLSVQA